jgi:hypothetical protein
LFGTRRISCSDARSRCAGVPPLASTNLKRESWKYPTNGSQAVTDAAVFGAAPAGVVCVTISPVDSFTSLTVGGE